VSEKIDVRYVAKLARLDVSEEEVLTYGAQLGNLLTYVDDLSKLPTDGVTATAQVVPLRNVARDDDVRPALDRETVLSMAPQAQGAYFRVPRIIGEPD